MADSGKVQCCASDAKSNKPCQKCAYNCTCSDPACVCMQIKTAAGMKGDGCCGQSCKCGPSCPCYKTKSAAVPDYSGLTLNACAAKQQRDPACNMPGNCNCCKGAVGKL